MHKILIATSNQDKFILVSKLFQKLGLQEVEFHSLNMLHQVSNLAESGSIEKRAKMKAIEFKELLSEYSVIIGVDDGILLPGSNTIETEVKRILRQIIYDKILTQGQTVKICRAFYFITKTQECSALTFIPFIYHDTTDVIIKPNSYPLSQVLSPLNTTKRIATLSEEEEMTYYQYYCKNELSNIIKSLNRELEV